MNAKLTKITVDHEEIKQWVEAHEGYPALIDSPEAGGDTPGIRIEFPGLMGDALLAQTQKSQPVSWEVFFEIFEKRKMAFVYVEKKQIANPTLAYKFILRDSVKDLI